jgi:hypothetical protein
MRRRMTWKALAIPFMFRVGVGHGEEMDQDTL